MRVAALNRVMRTGCCTPQCLTRAGVGVTQWLETVSAAAAPYLFDSAAQFARELWSFVASGLAVDAHDRAVFSLADEAPAAASAEAGKQGAWGRSFHPPPGPSAPMTLFPCYLHLAQVVAREHCIQECGGHEGRSFPGSGHCEASCL
jgi:hypothetical protein